MSVWTHFHLKFGLKTDTNQTSGALPAAAASNEAAAGALGLQEMARGTPSNTRRNGLQCGGGRGTEPAGDEATAGSEGSAMSRVYYGLSFFYLQKVTSPLEIGPSRWVSAVSVCPPVSIYSFADSDGQKTSKIRVRLCRRVGVALTEEVLS